MVPLLQRSIPQVVGLKKSTWSPDSTVTVTGTVTVKATTAELRKDLCLVVAELKNLHAGVCSNGRTGFKNRGILLSQGLS